MTSATLPADLVRLVSPAHLQLGSLRDLRLPPAPGESCVREDPLAVLNSLPVTKHINEFMRLLDRHGTVVVVAETGAGKSTALPLALMSRGRRVIVTEPRIVAARSLSQFVSELCREEVGGKVGYRTAHEGASSEDTKLLYCTDGLQLVRELLGHTANRDVVIVDEFHERNLNQDVLLAWLRRERLREPKLKLVVMSATVDAERISKYLGGCPIMRIPGRTFPVTELEPEGSLADDVERALLNGKNTLAFLPGKREIDELLSELDRRGVSAKLLPLHRDLSVEDQQRCFASYPLPKCIAATPIAEASITIPDIDVVVDSGLRRLIHTVNDVQGLYTEWISKSEGKQRAGRCARTKPGIYISHNRAKPEEQAEYPEPEISRLQFENFFLRLTCVGVKPDRFEFLDPPRSGETDRARENLEALGMLDSAGRPTALGESASHLPISVNLSRMLDEGRRQHVLDDTVLIAALIEAGGITDPRNKEWRQLCPDDVNSDLIAHRDLFRFAKDLFAKGEYQFLENQGIDLKSLEKAIECYKDITLRMEEIGWREQHPERRRSSKETRYGVLRAFLAGFPNRAYVQVKDTYRQAGSLPRLLRPDSFVRPDAQYVIGIPFDISTHVGESPRQAAHFLLWASAIPESMVPRYLREYEHEQHQRFKERDTKRRAPIGRSYRRNNRH